MRYISYGDAFKNQCVVFNELCSALLAFHGIDTSFPIDRVITVWIFQRLFCSAAEWADIFKDFFACEIYIDAIGGVLFPASLEFGMKAVSDKLYLRLWVQLPLVTPFHAAVGI